MRVPQEPGTKGSLKWIQEFVNHRSSALDAAIRSAAGDAIDTPIHWKSPLKEDQLAEYRDGDFLSRLGVSLPVRSLGNFWPERGPQWDALGVDTSGTAILVEAKAHLDEIFSTPTQAGEASKQKIQLALKETENYLGVKSTCDWSGRFYQYANRLAHLYLLHAVNHVDAYMVFVYFVGDAEMGGPKTDGEWRAAIKVLEGALGLRRNKLFQRRVDVFVDVSTGTFVRTTRAGTKPQ